MGLLFFALGCVVLMGVCVWFLYQDVTLSYDADAPQNAIRTDRRQR